MVQFHQTPWLDAVPHCSRKSDGVLPLPFPLSPCLYSWLRIPAPSSALVKVFVRSSMSQYILFGDEEFSKLSLTGTSSGSGDRAYYTDKSKEKRGLEEEAEGMNPSTLSSSKLLHLSDCT